MPDLASNPAPDPARALETRLDTAGITAILDAAHADGRTTLFEHEVYRVLEAAGASVPRRTFVAAGDDPAADARGLPPGDTLVMKIVAPGVAHKSEIGGVALVGRDPASLRAAMGAMLASVAAHGVRDPKGVLLVERATLAGGAGATSAEVLMALRQTREFGPVLTMGTGGLDTELMAASLRPGLGAVTASATLLDAPALLRAFTRTLAYQRLAGATRSAAGTRLVADGRILRTLEALRALGQPGAAGPWELTELEVNPFAATTAGDLVALDGLASFRPAAAPAAGRPLASIDALLAPRSIAVIGVSSKIRNLGRIILGNILAAGFDRSRTWIVRPGTDRIDGVACVPRIADLPERVDVFVIAVGADQVPAVMDEIVEADRATGVIVIPGGMAEKGGGEVFEGGLGAAVAGARERGLPLVVNGGNCLGIVSRPGRYDTLFIPSGKLPKPPAAEPGAADAGSMVAIVSQSGGFMITRLSKLPWFAPRYAISTGNQVDLTVGDFVRRIADDPQVRTIAAYVEGFRDGDGLAFARAVEAFTGAGGGRDVIFYKAGRTAEGRASVMGHTAAISGDYDVCASLVREAGAHVADSFDDFQALLKISVLMGARDWRGRRLGAVSNAGFEAVAIADRLRGDGWALEAAALSDSTLAALAAALAEGHADTLVDVRNPLDLTPMAGDAVHEAVVRALAGDPSVDVVLWSSVPLTDASATLPVEFAAAGEEALPARLAGVAASSPRPLIASVDAGPLFDPFAVAIEARGIPVFRSVDAALRAIGLYAAVRATRPGSHEVSA